jgi:hypothetical protein
VEAIGEEVCRSVVYGHAYPMVAPAIFPSTGTTAQRAHGPAVARHGRWQSVPAQDDAAWTGRESIVELLLKAAGWRVEFELMRRGVIGAMTINGIVEDSQLDHLVGEVAAGDPKLETASVDPSATGSGS